jgi:hypothetical protein
MKIHRLASKWVFMLVIPLILFSCESDFLPGIAGEGFSIESDLQLDDITGFSNSISANIFITQGNNQSAEIVGQQNIIDNISTEVIDGIWMIKYHDLVRRADTVSIYLTLPDVTKMEILGSGSIITTNYFSNLRNLVLTIGGSGEIDFEGETEGLDILVAGSGEVYLRGKSPLIDVFVSGSCNIEAKDFIVAEAKVNITGSGEMHFNVEDYLDVSISGSGDIYYIGYPEIESNISGSGNIINDN